MTLPRHSPTVREAADHIGVDPNSILRRIDSGWLETDYQEKFPSREGWRWRLKPDSVERDRYLTLIRNHLSNPDLWADPGNRQASIEAVRAWLTAMENGQ